MKVLLVLAAVFSLWLIPISASAAVTVAQQSASCVQDNVAAGTTSSITPTLPAAASAADTVIAAVYIDAGGLTSATITTPASWTLVASDYAATPNLRLSIYNIAGFTGSSQAFSLAVGVSGGWYAAACLLEVSGANNSAPVDSGSGFMTPLNYTTTGAKNGANNAPARANTLALVFFVANDDFQAFLSGAPTGWTQLSVNPSTAALYASMQSQSYNSTPSSGIALQSSVTTTIQDNTGPWLQGYELFVDPPGVGGLTFGLYPHEGAYPGGHQ